jgi:cytochrome P450
VPLGLRERLEEGHRQSPVLLERGPDGGPGGEQHPRRVDVTGDPDLAERTDVLAMLVRAGEGDGSGMTDVVLRDQPITLLMAGHETTATALTWALERLVRHPEPLRRAVAAADVGDPAGDEFLDGVLKETLRSRPVIHEVARTLTRPTEVAGYQLHAGVTVMPAIGLVHASAEHYPDPARFDPDRMLGVPLSPSTWFPFGGGGRRCLGATFAQVEMRVVLREVLRRVDLASTDAPAERQTVKHITLVPGRGGRIRVRARREIPLTATESTAASPTSASSTAGGPTAGG